MNLGAASLVLYRTLSVDPRPLGLATIMLPPPTRSHLSGPNKTEALGPAQCLRCTMCPHSATSAPSPYSSMGPTPPNRLDTGHRHIRHRGLLTNHPLVAPKLWHCLALVLHHCHGPRPIQHHTVGLGAICPVRCHARHPVASRMPSSNPQGSSNHQDAAIVISDPPTYGTSDSHVCTTLPCCMPSQQ